MQITKNKKSNAIILEVRDTKVAWFIEPIANTSDISEKIPEGVQLVLVNTAKALSTEEFLAWDVLSQKLKKEREIVIILTPGEYRVGEVHLKGSSLDAMAHYVLETPEGTVGFIACAPGDNFVKQYSPIDVIVGKDTSLASSQLDMEPFYVILPEVTEEYKKKSGISEVKEVEKVTIKKIEATDREGAVSMQVYAL